MANPPPDLLAETERLVKSIVRDARKKQRVTQADGTTKIVTPEMLDRTRAADVALRFMAMKNKIDPPPQGGEFNADLEDYHNERDGSRGGDASAGEDGTAPRHTSH